MKYSLATHLAEGDVVIWDRLGRAGRARNPQGLHFSPIAKKEILTKGAEVRFLPPRGKLFNPIENANSYIKGYICRRISADPSSIEAGEVSFNKLEEFFFDATATITPRLCRAWFRNRANGREYFRVMKGVRKRNLVLKNIAGVY